MEKLKLTRIELKKQKDNLKRFLRYLPTLQLKKQQLQLEITKIRHNIDRLASLIDKLYKNTSVWVDVFAEEIHQETFFPRVEGIKTITGNVAGVDIPIFESVTFKEGSIDYLKTPFWVDTGIEVCKEMLKLKAEIDIAHKQEDILKEELRITTQRVNLFEKVKIPQTRENIRILQIYLGDLQTAEVVRGKIAKAKIEKKKLELVR